MFEGCLHVLPSIVTMQGADKPQQPLRLFNATKGRLGSPARNVQCCSQNFYTKSRKRFRGLRRINGHLGISACMTDKVGKEVHICAGSLEAGWLPAMTWNRGLIRLKLSCVPPGSGQEMKSGKASANILSRIDLSA